MAWHETCRRFNFTPSFRKVQENERAPRCNPSSALAWEWSQFKAKWENAGAINFTLVEGAKKLLIESVTKVSTEHTQGSFSIIIIQMSQLVKSSLLDPCHRHSLVVYRLRTMIWFWKRKTLLLLPIITKWRSSPEMELIESLSSSQVVDLVLGVANLMKMDIIMTWLKYSILKIIIRKIIRIL